jgi:hypothetical protein
MFNIKLHQLIILILWLNLHQFAKAGPISEYYDLVVLDETGYRVTEISSKHSNSVYTTRIINEPLIKGPSFMAIMGDILFIANIDTIIRYNVTTRTYVNTYLTDCRISSILILDSNTLLISQDQEFLALYDSNIENGSCATSYRKKITNYTDCYGNQIKRSDSGNIIDLTVTYTPAPQVGVYSEYSPTNFTYLGTYSGINCTVSIQLKFKFILNYN